MQRKVLCDNVIYYFIFFGALFSIFNKKNILINLWNVMTNIAFIGVIFFLLKIENSTPINAMFDITFHRFLVSYHYISNTSLKMYVTQPLCLVTQKTKHVS